MTYPEYNDKSELLDCRGENLNAKIESLWNNLPVFRDSMNKVPTIHIPNNKALIEEALNDPDFRVSTAGEPGVFFYKAQIL
jgi:hypothetical protein